MSEYKLLNGNSVELLKTLDDNSVDLVVTSPPYDDLRNYNNSNCFTFEVFCKIADELFRVVKEGGVIIWVVADKTDKGSETGISFKQALYFKEIGFNIHDTMIYQKANYVPLTHNRYEQEFEYMFCFSKGKPKTFNPIKIPCKWAGTETWGSPSVYKTDADELTKIGKSVINDTKIHGNIFTYQTGSTTISKKFKHPAMFPIDLAKDQIMSWSNEGDVVLDPFMGSCTTGDASLQLQRNFIGIELEETYFKMAEERLKQFQQQSIWDL